MGVSIIVAGCLGEPAPEPKTATKTNALFVDSGNIWGKLHIPVCFENAGDNNVTARGWVQDAVTASWQAHSKITFTGWGKCASGADGIRILISDSVDAPHTNGLGRDLNGEEDGMVLNFSFHNWDSSDCEGSSVREGCIRRMAVHEFGHALGFAHEQNRDDTPASCTQPAQGDDGDTTVGAWDIDSVMNYCNMHNDGTLSSTDIRGLQAYYGHPDAATMRIAAVNLGQNKFYTFRGGLYSRIDGDDRVMDSGYPRSIADNWGNWPAAWGNDGIDAALNWDGVSAYFFRGSQYVKVDIASKTVLAGYPKTTATFWHNWPPGWTSVDAAIDWGNGKYYFFRGDKYVRYDKGNDSVDPGYPLTISDHWPGLFSANIDSAFNDGNGKAYFFNGNVYDRVDIDDGEHDIDDGYPANIVGNWPGVLF